jgi:arabinan endo-1,5-alpha-L-arabinosidase
MTMLRALLLCAATALALPAQGLDGEILVHDPSTVVSHAGRYYTFGTGNGIPVLSSDDGWTWKRSGSLMSAVPGGKAGSEVLAKGGNNTWAPDVIRSADQYFVYYSAPGTQPRSAIGLLAGRTLDPASPDYRWEDRGPVVWSDGIEDSNAIDPGVLLDATDGRLWMVYGSYFGYIRLVELDPRTGLRRHPDRRPVNVAINSEAAILIQRDGWYYLLVTHGSCCQGANSTYNIRMGRSRKVTGPYLDNMGIDMIEGGGKLFAASRGRHIGPGHFGLLVEDGVEKFSLHYEADLDRGGVSVLDIRPLLWRDGWPIAGDNVSAGIYNIESARTGTVLELAVQGFPVGGFRQRRGGPPGSGIVGTGGSPSGPPPEPQIGPPIADQEPAHVAANWPATSGVRLAPAMLQAQQKWVIAPVANAGGYPGAPYFRITIAGTERSLTVTAGAELTALPFTGAPEQLWRIDQLTDGSHRIAPKAVPGTSERMALSAVGSSMPTLAKFDPSSDRQRWRLGAP